MQYQRARAEAQVEMIQAITQAVRTLDQTVDRTELAHPLALRFMDVIARAVDQTLHESSRSNIKQAEVDKLVKDLRAVLGPDLGRLARGDHVQ